MGAFLGAEGRKPSAASSRLPRPAASVLRSELRKTIAGVAPAANAPPGLATPAGPSHDDTQVDDKPPASSGLVGKAPLSKPPTSFAPATRRIAGNAPLPPRAPSVAPPPLPEPPAAAPPAALPMPASYAPPPMLAPPPPPAPSTPKAFAPANGRAGSADDASGALTYQVYAPESLPAPRPMNFSRVSLPDIAPKPSIAARVGLALVAACVIVGTAALIAFGTADEPRARSGSGATATASQNASAAASAPPIVAAPSPEPPPAMSASVADPPAPLASAPVGKKRPKAKAVSSAGSLGGVALPPNPFSGGNVGAAPPKAPKKK